MKSVLITGASKGLGYALAEEFLKNNWIVYALARNINSIKILIDKYKDTCIPIQADVTSDNSADIIKKAIESNTNSLDLLINNAGNAEKLFGFDNVSPVDLDNHFKVHVSGAFRIIKSCLPFMENSKDPVIINVSSRKGSIQKINSGEYRILIPYQVAKAAQNMLTVCLNQEFKDSKIEIYAIHPGNIKTEVAPTDADTEPAESAAKIYNWVNLKDKPSVHNFYNIMDGKTLNW